MIAACPAIFIDLLGLPEPDFNLAVGSTSHWEQTARVMIGLEKLFFEIAPAAVIVYGDVNSTLAASLVTAKLQIPCLHVEAGLRSTTGRCQRNKTVESPTSFRMYC
jgi:UDP-N-acetylglucosamine 2-epimerase (non-hydrolysing)